MRSTSSDKKALGISLIAALAGVVLLRLYMHRFEQEASGGPPTRVVVFARDIETGEALGRAALAVRVVPRAYVESRHIPASDLDGIVGSRLTVAGRAREAVLWTDLANMRRSDQPLSSLVPEGMRAISLDLRAGAFDDLLRPGDRVDVLLSRDGEVGAAATTVRLLESVLVLAVGDDTGATVAPRRKRARGSRVTLSATPDQSRILAQGERDGALRLVLRNPDDLVLSQTAEGQRRDVIAPPQGTPDRAGEADAR